MPLNSEVGRNSDIHGRTDGHHKFHSVLHYLYGNIVSGEGRSPRLHAAWQQYTSFTSKYQGQ